MYALVEDIEAYPRFLPWCAAAVVHERRPDATKATLTVGLGGLRHSFTTLNENRPGEAIDMRLVEGPFRRFHGEWRFVALGAARLAASSSRCSTSSRAARSDGCSRRSSTASPTRWWRRSCAARPRSMKVEVVYARPEGAETVSLEPAARARPCATRSPPQVFSY